MLGYFNAFHCDEQSGGVFSSGAFPPPLNYLNGVWLSFRSMWAIEELEAKFSVDIQDFICSNELEKRPCNLPKPVLVLLKVSIGSRFLHIDKIQNFKEENDFRTFVVLLDEVAEALIEDDVLLPFWDGGLVPLEIERLGHDREDVLDTLSLIERRDRPVAVLFLHILSSDLIY